jgi:hypothetical protein
MNEKKTMTLETNDYAALDEICDMIYENNIKSLKELRYYIQKDLDEKKIKEVKGLNRFFEAHIQLLTLYFEGDFSFREGPDERPYEGPYEGPDIDVNSIGDPRHLFD